MKKQKSIDKLKQQVKEMKAQSGIKEEPKAEPKKEAIDEKDKQIADLTETLQRLQAEFENYKKYIEKQNADFRKYAKSELIMNILPILDSFELALKNTSDKERFVKGVELIYSQLFSTLKKEGLKPIETKEKILDASKHEVLLRKKSDEKEDTILEELQKGYMLHEKVLRHSKVAVSRK